MPKLLMLANHFVSHGGGLERMAHDLATYMRKQAGHDVTLVAHGSAPRDIPYRCIPIRASALAERLTGLPVLIPHPGDLGAIKNAVMTSDCVVLHDNLYLSHLYAQRIARKAGKPVLLIKHTGWVQGGSGLSDAAQSAANRFIFGPSLKAANRVVAVTEAKRTNLVTQMGDISVDIVENGIDTVFFTPGEEQRDIDLLFIGRFVDKKGIGLVRELASRLPDLRIACAGFGPVDPQQWALANLAIISSPDGEEIRRTYRRSRLTLAPCLSEGTPLIVPESLACGTPVLASDHAAHAHLPVGTTLPIDLDWPETIVSRWIDAVQARLAAATDPSELHRAVEAHFSLSATGKRYAALINSMLG